MLELMGHRRLGGFLTLIEIAGKGFLRVDIPTPETKDECGPWSATQIYSPDAVYCITPTTLEIARVAAAASVVAPVSRWELPAAEKHTDRVDLLTDDEAEEWARTHRDDL